MSLHLSSFERMQLYEIKPLGKREKSSKNQNHQQIRLDFNHTANP